MKKNNLLLLGAFCALSIFSSCDDDDVPAIEYEEQGVIKGTITGTASDDATTINEQFSYSRYNPGYYDGPYASSYILDDDGSIEMQIIRQDVQLGGGVRIGLYLESASDTSPEYQIRLDYLKETDKILYFSTSADSYFESDNESSISNFSFDSASGRVKGDFTISGNDNSTDNNAIVSGSFDVVVKQSIE
jgi:hypothetical protein